MAVAVDEKDSFEAVEDLVVADVSDTHFLDGESVDGPRAGGSQGALEIGGGARFEEAVAAGGPVDLGEGLPGAGRGRGGQFDANDEGGGLVVGEGFEERVGLDRFGEEWGHGGGGGGSLMNGDEGQCTPIGAGGNG